MQFKAARIALLFVLTCMITLLTGCGSQSAAQPSSMPMTAARAPVAPPATAPVVELTVLKFTEPSIKAIQAGTKTATIRKGVRTFPTGIARAVGADGNVVMLDIVSAAPKKMSELTAGDAAANGSASLDSLKTQLAKDYANIADSDVVTVVVFRLKGGSGV